MANTWFENKVQRKISNRVNGNETKIDFVLVGTNNRKYLQGVKAIPWELQYRLVVTDIGKRKLKKVVKNEQKVGLEVEGKQHENKISRKS